MHTATASVSFFSWVLWQRLLWPTPYPDIQGPSHSGLGFSSHFNLPSPPIKRPDPGCAFGASVMPQAMAQPAVAPPAPARGDRCGLTTKASPLQSSPCLCRAASTLLCEALRPTPALCSLLAVTTLSPPREGGTHGHRPRLQDFLTPSMVTERKPGAKNARCNHQTNTITCLIHQMGSLDATP